MTEKITTVCGEISTEDLGFCHSHEHIWTEKSFSANLNSNLIIDDYNLSLQELTAFHLAGCSSIVDCQPISVGRNPEILYQLSKESGVQIIASTGFHMRQFYSPQNRIFSLTMQEAQHLFETELCDGMFSVASNGDYKQTKIRAGVIKCALDLPSNFYLYKNLFDAAVNVSILTGAPLLVHVERGANAIEFVDYLKGKHIPLEHVILCHMDRAEADLDIHAQVATTGIYLEYDTIARYKYHDDTTEMCIIKELLSRGMGDRILLGLDSTRSRLSAYGGSPGLCFIKQQFMTNPLADRLGILNSDFQRFMVFNPAKAFRIRPH